MIIPVQKSRVFETVCEQMIDIIEQGLWKEGERIPGEIELSNEFKVSRNSLRTAIKVLHTSEIVESKPGLGTFVADDALKKIKNNRLLSMLQDEGCFDDILEVRYIFEKETAYIAAVKRTEDDIKQLEECNKKLKEAIKNKDVEKTVYWGNEFHLRIIKCTGNKLLINMYESLKSSLNQDKQKIIEQNDFDKLYEDYTKRDEQIIQAIKNKDSALAETLMEDHLLNRWKYRKK